MKWVGDIHQFFQRSVCSGTSVLLLCFGVPNQIFDAILIANHLQIIIGSINLYGLFYTKLQSKAFIKLIVLTALNSENVFIKEIRNATKSNINVRVSSRRFRK